MRSLLLAGGGIKAGYQAGCLQVLLDEVGSAKLSFDHIDAASGGCFNAAMLCSGKSGTEIAAAWRNMNPLDLVSFNVPELRKGLWARSIATLDAVRTKGFRDWGIDFERIRTWSGPPVTFNYFNFTQKVVEVVLPAGLDADYLAACVALPIWFPPIEKDGRTLIDAVFATDSNIAQARARGATEIWAIWTVAREARIRDGFVAQYFHMLEQSANANFIVGCASARQAGIDLHVLRQEVPIHYLFNFSRDRMAAIVDLGIGDMRAYCHGQGLLPTVFAVPAPPAAPVRPRAAGVRFSETLTGAYFVRDDGGLRHEAISVQVTLESGDIETFVRDRDHRARVRTGSVTARAFGGRRDIARGEVSILVDARDADDVIIPGSKRMLYRLWLRARNGTPYLIVGTKYLIDFPGKDLWRDSTTLYLEVRELADDRPGMSRVHGAGIVRLTPRAFVRQLKSFRTSGTSDPRTMAGLLRRFFQFFIRHCWDVYARTLLDYAPF